MMFYEIINNKYRIPIKDTKKKKREWTKYAATKKNHQITRDKKERETSKQKTLNKIAILRMYLSIIKLNLNELNIQ